MRRGGIQRRRCLLWPEPDVADDVGHPAVEGEDGSHRHCGAPLLVVVVLHLDVEEDV